MTKPRIGICTAIMALLFCLTSCGSKPASGAYIEIKMSTAGDAITVTGIPDGYTDEKEVLQYSVWLRGRNNEEWGDGYQAGTPGAAAALAVRHSSLVLGRPGIMNLYADKIENYTDNVMRGYALKALGIKLRPCRKDEDADVIVRSTSGHDKWPFKEEITAIWQWRLSAESA